jgi:two-component system nitrogen regulation sensor histidine kinase NtrY
MGLGLGIVKSIISSHRGKISYKSKNNKGTVFTISLPK